MTDKPDSSYPSNIPPDYRGIQPGLMLGGIFAAAIGMGALIMRARSSMRSRIDKTPSP